MAGVICRISSVVPFHGPFPGIDTLTPSHTFLATSPSSNNTLTTPHAPPVSRSTRASTPFTTPYALKYFLNAAALVNGDRFVNSNAFGGGGGKVDACPNGPPRTESYSYDSSYNSIRIFFLPPGRRLGSTTGSSTAGSRIHRASIARNTHPRAVIQHLALHSHQHFPLPLLALILLPPLPTTYSSRLLRPTRIANTHRINEMMPIRR
ncbi:hypothetical protein BDZ89DRAFT_1078272 [Hymenopellis radicata]|nr:hypothetical protein BDZ89DRAFT_1078272 [Hymenopellis radicata]